MLSYEEMGKLEADRSAIPNTCLSFTESAFYVAEAANNVFNDIFMNIGINELAVFEATGAMVVYEGFSLKDIKEKIAAGLDKVWQAIKAAFEKVKDFFDQKIKENAKKYQKLTSADINSLPNDTKFLNNIHEWDIDKALATIEDGKRKVDSLINNEFNIEDDADISAFSSTANEVLSQINGLICGEKKEMDRSEMAKAVKELATGKEVELTKSYLASNINDFNKIASEGTTTIKKSYRDEKKAVDDAKQKLKSFKEKDMNIANYRMRCEQNAIMAYHTAVMAIFDAEKARYKEIMVVLVQATKLCKKSNNESAEINFEDAVNEAFSW